MTFTGNIYTAMVAFFEDDDWHYHPLSDAPVLSMGFTGKNGKWMCFAQAREEQHQFVFYSVCPVNVPDDRLSVIVEFITRANYGMIIGNFEVDYHDGEIRYKTSIDVEGDRLSSSLVKQMVYANVLIMDRYLSGMMRVIYGDASPAEEVKRIEAGQTSPNDDDKETNVDYEDDDLKFSFSLDDIDFSKLDVTKDDPDSDSEDSPAE